LTEKVKTMNLDLLFPSKRFAQLLGAVSLAGFLSGAAMAQDYPSKPVRLTVAFAPGGTTDLVARIVADPLGKFLGQPVVVDNKPGGGGAVAAAELARMAPDGYSLGIAGVGPTAASPAINPGVKYDPLADFTPIVNIAATPNVLVVHPSFPVKDFKGFLAEIKKNPGKYSYASAGIGGIAHLKMESFKALGHLFITHIPYRGSAPALNDTMSGTVPIMYDNLPSALPFIKAGKLVAIAVAAPKRVADLPQVPTFQEVGFEPINRMAYYGIWGPRGMPADVVQKLNAGVKQALADPAVRRRIEDTNSIVIGNSPQEFAAQIKQEFELAKKVVKQQNLKPE